MITTSSRTDFFYSIYRSIYLSGYLYATLPILHRSFVPTPYSNNREHYASPNSSLARKLSWLSLGTSKPELNYYLVADGDDDNNNNS